MPSSSSLGYLRVAALWLVTASCIAAEPRAIFYRDDYADLEADSRIARHDLVVDGLAGHLEWLRAHGYEPITLASLGSGTPPAHGVLLGFERATQDFVERILPVLRAFEWPAVLAVPVLDVSTPVAGAGSAARQLTPAELRELVAGGGIELVATGGSLLRPIMANAAGDLSAPVSTRYYDLTSERYESVAAQAVRIETALSEAHERWARRMGYQPDVWWWPEGDWTAAALRASRAVGFRTTLATTTLAQPPSIIEMPVLGQALTVAAPLAEFIDTIRGDVPPVEHRLLEVALTLTAGHLDLQAARIADSAAATGVDVLLVHPLETTFAESDRTAALLDHLVSRLQRNPLLRVYLRIDLDGVGTAVLGTAAEWVGRVHADGYVFEARHADAATRDTLRRMVAELRPQGELRLVGSIDSAGSDNFGERLVIEGARAAELLTRLPPAARAQVWAILTPSAGADLQQVLHDLRALRDAHVRHLGIRWEVSQDDAQKTYSVLAQELSVSRYPYLHD